MNKLIAVSVCLALLLAVAQSRLVYFKNDVQKINRAAPAWTAGVNDIFEGKSLQEIRAIMGFKKNPDRPSLPIVDDVADDVPDTFDARTAWPTCTVIGTIQNQAMCGSCWAFGAVEAFTDRMCIHKGFTGQLSFMDMVTCDGRDGGCDGGDPYTAWDYAKRTGLVTEPCSPYTIPTCPPEEQPCLKFVDTPKCVRQCNNSETWNGDKHKASTAYGVKSDPASIQTEIMNNGPVEACFTVYKDFLSYKSGVYTHTTGDALGGHCIKLLGWGTENSTDYWLVANSWTSTWGDEGYFKIARGTNECGIEDEVAAGMP